MRMPHANGRARAARRRLALLSLLMMPSLEPRGCTCWGIPMSTGGEPKKEDWRDTHKEEVTDTLACPTSMKSARRDKAVPTAPDMAVVVFVRPSDARSDTDVIVVDDAAPSGGAARFLGQSQAAAYFAVTVAPGEHRFLGWANDAAGLRAALLPGKRYYVEVALDFGLPAHTRLSAVSPSGKTWKKLPDWLAESAAQVPDEPSGQACLNLSPRKLADWTGRARAALAHYDASDLAERTLRPEDGQ